jgi:peptidoglycan hydrolase-like protein with peptidoglycan-binding domain
MSMEALSTMNANVPVAPEAKTVETKATELAAANASGVVKLEALPPVGPYNPTGIEIQTALKNASLYTGAIDGKIGPMTKAAIVAFQKANGLQADGKVGPKTWAAMSKYLNPAPVVSAPVKR